MMLDDQYLAYPHRKYGMDHDRYDWNMLANRKPIQWPEGKKVALWINVSVQHFPLDQSGKPFKVPGGMTMPYPDLRHYTLRDFGNRVGIYRILKAFERYQIRPSFAVNAAICERYPYLMGRLLDGDSEFMAHGWHMDSLHYNDLGAQTEKEIIQRSISTLQSSTGRDIAGWLSPARNESEVTPDLIREAGISYLCDWVNDDMPYTFKTSAGDLTAMPLSSEIEDRYIIMHNQHSESSYVTQVKAAYEFLLEEAQTQGGRILSLSIHPWLLGHAHRIKYLEELLEYLSGQPEVWMAHPGEIAGYWKSVGS